MWNQAGQVFLKGLGGGGAREGEGLAGPDALMPVDSETPLQAARERRAQPFWVLTDGFPPALPLARLLRAPGSFGWCGFHPGSFQGGGSADSNQPGWAGGGTGGAWHRERLVC